MAVTNAEYFKQVSSTRDTAWCCGLAELGNFALSGQEKDTEAFTNIVLDKCRELKKGMVYATLNEEQANRLLGHSVLTAAGFVRVSEAYNPNSGNIFYLYVNVLREP